MTAQRIEAVAPIDEAGAAREMDALADRLQPGVNRAQVLERLDSLFRAGKAPDPWPEGFLPGRLLTTSVWGPLDSGLLRAARHWMPWKGKTFDAEARAGVNRFDNTAANRAALKVLFPGYTPERVTAERIEAFPMRNRVEAGALDRDVEVFKIDYDFEANPALIRRILDELVQVSPGLYLGKVLFRFLGRHRQIGFFSLRT
jgi:hypothetical protein